MFVCEREERFKERRVRSEREREIVCLRVCE